MTEPTRCPACSGKLSSEASGEHVLYGCDDCGGVFALPDTAKSIVRGLGKRFKSEVDAIESFAPVKRKRPPGGEDPVPRPCPVCGLPMEMGDAAGVDVDICNTDGTWFDRGEIALIAKHMGTDDELPSPTKAETGSSGIDAMDVGIAGIGLLFTFLVDD